MFIAIFENGNFIEKKTIAELSHLENVKLYIEKSVHSQHITGSGTPYNFYSYQIRDREGKPSNIAPENEWFSIESLGHEKRTSSPWCDLTVKIYDKVKSTVFNQEIHTKSGNIFVFRDKIFPLIEKLVTSGSWEIYCIGNENEMLKIQNTDLQNQIEELKIELTPKG
jgi:hypothetical protein